MPTRFITDTNRVISEHWCEDRQTSQTRMKFKKKKIIKSF